MTNKPLTQLMDEYEDLLEETRDLINKETAKALDDMVSFGWIYGLGRLDNFSFVNINGGNACLTKT